jgi:hypothetical protein
MIKKTLSTIAVLFSFFLASAHAQTMQIKTSRGVESREVTRTLPASNQQLSPAGKTFYYGGSAEDGVRKFNADGTGSYIDGQRTGSFAWGFAAVGGKPVIKSFKEWGDQNHSENTMSAVQIYVNFTGGALSGASYTEIVGLVSPTSAVMYVSPMYYTKN